MTVIQMKNARDEYIKGAKVNDLAKEYCVSSATIYRCLQRGDHKIRRANRINAIMKDYYGKFSIEEVLSKYNIKYRTLLLYIGEYKRRK